MKISVSYNSCDPYSGQMGFSVQCYIYFVLRTRPPFRCVSSVNCSLEFMFFVIRPLHCVSKMRGGEKHLFSWLSEEKRGLLVYVNTVCHVSLKRL